MEMKARTAGKKAVLDGSKEEFEKFKPKVARGIRRLAVATIALIVISVSGLAGVSSAGVPFNAAGRFGSQAAYVESPGARFLNTNYINGSKGGAKLFINTPLSDSTVANVTLAGRQGNDQVSGRGVLATRTKLVSVGVSADVSDIGGTGQFAGFGFGIERAFSFTCNGKTYTATLAMDKAGGVTDRIADMDVGPVTASVRSNGKSSMVGSDVRVGMFTPHLATDCKGYWEGGSGLPGIGPVKWGNLGVWHQVGTNKYGAYLAIGY